MSSEESRQDERFSLKAWLYRSGLTGKMVGVGLSDVDLESEVASSVTHTQTDIQRKALMLLGLFEEYFLRGGDEGESLQHLLDLSQEADMEVLLKKLEKGDEALLEDAPVRASEVIKQQIKLLLSDQAVRGEFFRLLRKEAELFKGARPTLKKVELFRSLRERIASGVVRLYLRDKQKHGRLLQNTANAIAHLEKKRSDADAEEARLRARASFTTRSWIHVQELLNYKTQLAETGFAKTPSRQQLLDRVLLDIAHGNKVFLVGSTGTGKTQLAILVADLVNNNGFEIVSWHEGTTPRDLFGYREVWQGEEGIQSGTKKGPVALAITGGKIVIHDEYTVGSTRAQLSAKAQLNARVGGTTRLPGFNGEVFTVEEGFGEIFTGNPRDERTKAREDMDPAILRMLSGVKVSYMPADELFKVLLAQFIEETGLMPLSEQEIEMVRKLTQAAQLMQMCHDREVKVLEASDAKDVIQQIFGGRLDEVHLDKSFLDTGSLLRLFKGWDLQKARGAQFRTFLKGQLENFIADPKFDTDKEERKLARAILDFYFGDGLVDLAAVSDDGAESYVLPSKLGAFFGESLEDDVDFEEDLDDEARLEAKLEKLHGLLGSPDAPTPPKPPERPHHNELKAFLEAQFGAARETAEIFNIGTGDKRLPNKSEVERALLKTVTEEQWREIQNFRKPQLLIVPYPTSKDRYETAFNDPRCKTPSNANDAQFYSFAKETFAADSACTRSGGKVKGYRFVITDGDASLTNHGDWNQETVGSQVSENKERIEAFNAHFAGKMMEALDYPAYILLQMAAMRARQPIDSETYTLLTKHQRDGRVAVGGWDPEGRNVYLGNDYLDSQDHNARVRASVMGDIEF